MVGIRRSARLAANSDQPEVDESARNTSQTKQAAKASTAGNPNSKGAKTTKGEKVKSIKSKKEAASQKVAEPTRPKATVSKAKKSKAGKQAKTEALPSKAIEAVAAAAGAAVTSPRLDSTSPNVTAEKVTSSLIATDAGSRRNTLDKAPKEWGALVMGGRSQVLPHRDAPSSVSNAMTSAEGKDGTNMTIGTAGGGRPVSGRWWKPVAKKRASAMVRKPKGNRRQAAWQARKLKEKEIKDAITLQQELKAESTARKTAQREKINARKKLREENEKKSQVVQVITNTRKIKKLNRKQLRNIEKR